jgi:hypothetical protein
MVNNICYFVVVSYQYPQEYVGAHQEYGRYVFHHTSWTMFILSKGFLFYHEKQVPQHMYSEYDVAGPSVPLLSKIA